MATTPVSVRVDETQAEAVREVAKSFNNGAEFGNWLLGEYKKHQSSNKADMFLEDISKIDAMFKSVVGVMSGIISKAEGEVLSKGLEIQEELRSKDAIAEDLKAEAELVREDLKIKEEEIKSYKESIADFKQQLVAIQKELDKAQQDLKTTVKLNEMLEQKQAQHEAVQLENEFLIKELANLKERLAISERQHSEGLLKIETLEKDKLSLEKTYVDRINALEKAHEQALIHEAGVKDLEVSKARLEIQEQSQAKIQAHMDKENELRDTIDHLKELHQQEIYSINKSIEELKESHKKEISTLQKTISDLKK